MPIVVVDDDRLLVSVMTRILGSAGFRAVHGTTDGRSATALCQRVGADLVIVDIHMPGMDGLELLRSLSARCPGLPALVLTADDDAELKYRAFNCGARDFLTKSVSDTEVFLRVVNLLDLRRMQKALVGANRGLEQAVRERTSELELSRVEIVERLAMAAQFRDDGSEQHVLRMGRIAGLIAANLAADEQVVRDLQRAAALHDVGKLAVPESILLKPGPLDEHEWKLIQRHPAVGAQLLSGSTSPLLQLAREIALSHHERWDGSGYPNRLSGTQIPWSGRVVAVADVFEALTSERPYKPAWPVEEAVAEIAAQSGRHFDPHVVEAFLALGHAQLLEPSDSRSGDGSFVGWARRA